MAHPHIILQEKHTVTSLSQLRQCLSTSSQPQCNKWVNGGAVPSSEADSRAFSFDIIPSSQIDNLTIVKDAKDMASSSFRMYISLVRMPLVLMPTSSMGIISTMLSRRRTSTRIRSHTATPSSLQSRATSILIHGHHWLVQMTILLSQEAHCSVPQVSPVGQVSTP